AVTFFVAALATPWYAVHPPSAVGEAKSVLPVAVDRGLDVVYPTTYSAGGTESDEETRSPIQGGDRVEVDLHLVAAPALHVIFRDEQQENGAFGMPTLRKRAFD